MPKDDRPPHVKKEKTGKDMSTVKVYSCTKM